MAKKNKHKKNDAGQEILEAFDQMGEAIQPEIGDDSSIPEIKNENKKTNTLPLYGFYGEQFFSSTPSAELLEKERKRFYADSETSNDMQLLEDGLCAKYNIVPPKKWSNKRKDRGESGEQILVLGKTADDRRNPKLWGIRQEDRTRHAFIIGGSGMGKSVTLDTLILREDGWTAVGDINIGDRVYGRDGELATVTHIFEQDALPVWEIEFADHQVVRCSAEHLWTVISESHGRKNENVVPLWTLYEKGVAIKKKSYSVHPFAIPMCEPVNFPERDLPIHPYILGALIGDGCIVSGHRPQMSSADKELIDRMEFYSDGQYQFTKSTGYNWDIKERDNNGQYSTPKQLIQKLEELNLRHRSENKFIPEIYKLSSIEQRRLLLQGLMDTDGSACNGRFLYTTISEQLRDDIMELARSLGYHVAYGIDKRADKYPNSEGKCYNIAIHSSDYENIFALTRKKEDFLHYASNRSNIKQLFDFKIDESLEEEDLIIDVTLPIHPYLLGAFLRFNVGDHSFSTNKELSEEQIEALLSKDSRLEMRKREYSITTTPYIDGGRMKNGKHKNLVLYAFRELGLNVKNTEKRIPELYLNSNYATRLALFQGITDHNGNFSHRYWEIYSINEDFIEDIEKLAHSLGFVHTNRGTDKAGSHYVNIVISDLSMFTLPSRIEYAKTILKKNTKHREFNYDENKIIDIRPTDDVEPMRCFIVDNPSHTYLIEGYIVTHNSTLLHSIGAEDMWYWRGGMIIEPHGDLCDNLLKCAPPYRIHDIIYLDLLDDGYSPGFNPLDIPLDATEEMRSEAVGRVESLIAKHFNMESGYVHLRKMLSNALNALVWCPGSTMLEIMDFYTDENVRNSVLAWMPEGPMKDSVLDTAMKATAQDLGSLDSRIQQMTMNRNMKHLFGQSKSTIDFYTVMNDGAYVICPIRKGGTTNDLFIKFCGSYIVSEVYKSALQRTDIPEMERVNFSLMLDECQNFISDDISGILSESRKFGLSLMLANQYLGQLVPTSIKLAVLQNCGTKLVYNQSVIPDAKELCNSMGPGITPNDLQAIPKYHVMASPLVRGEQVQPFISSVFPPLSIVSEVADITASLIVENSREKYMRPRDVIEQEIRERKERLKSGNKDAIVELVLAKNK